MHTAFPSTLQFCDEQRSSTARFHSATPVFLQLKLIFALSVKCSYSDSNLVLFQIDMKATYLLSVIRMFHTDKELSQKAVRIITGRIVDDFKIWQYTEDACCNPNDA